MPMWQRDAWYAEAVEYVRDNGLMSGTSATTFAPNDTMTRSMLATTLYREAGSPAVSGSRCLYRYPGGCLVRADAVLWASQEGVISGYGNGLFGTNDPVSREQIATILWRMPEAPAPVPGRTSQMKARSLPMLWRRWTGQEPTVW